MNRIRVNSEIEISQIVLEGDFGERPDQDSFDTLDLFFSCDGRAIEWDYASLPGKSQLLSSRSVETDVAGLPPG